MDRNYFLLRRDEELSWASSATCEAARQAHIGLAECFEEAAEKLGRPAQATAGGRSAHYVSQHQ